MKFIESIELKSPTEVHSWNGTDYPTTVSTNPSEQHAFYHRIGYTRSPIISLAIRQGFISMLETCHRRAQPFEIRKSYDNKPLFAGLQHTVSRRYCAPCTCSLSLFSFNFRSTLQTLSRFRYQLLNRSVGEHVGRGGTPRFRSNRQTCKVEFNRCRSRVK